LVPVRILEVVGITKIEIDDGSDLEWLAGRLKKPGLGEAGSKTDERLRIDPKRDTHLQLPGRMPWACLEERDARLSAVRRDVKWPAVQLGPLGVLSHRLEAEPVYHRAAAFR